MDRMGLEDIRKELDLIDRRILEYSVDKKLDVQVMEEMLEVLYRINEQFLSMNFLRVDIKDLEDVRFNLLECIYNVKVMIGEKMGIDVSIELDLLRQMGGGEHEL